MMKLIPGNAHPTLAANLAQELRCGLEPVEVGAFADGEVRVHVASDVRDAVAVIVQPTCPPVNDHLMILALLIDAIRAAGAARTIALVPYFGYARQEQRSRNGDPRSAQVVARLLEAVGLDQLVTLDLHAPPLESALRMPVTLLDAVDVFVPHVRAWGIKDPVVVAPDAGGFKRAQRYAAALGYGMAAMAKRRPGPDETRAVGVLGDVRDRACIIVDDMASTGRTLLGATEALLHAGASEVHAVFTHAVMAPSAFERLAAAPLGHLMTSDSIPVKAHPRLQVVSIASTLACAVRQLCGASVSSLDVNKR